MDSDASVMEGNDIQDLGGGSFRTVGTVSRYSPLDQYAMGLRTEAEVPAFFYVDSPTNVSNGAKSDSAPRTGVTFSGTRAQCDSSRRSWRRWARASRPRRSRRACTARRSSTS